MIHNLEQAKRAHTGHFFDASAIKFFKARFYKFFPIPGGAYFITSEQDEGYPRRYTIRHISDDGSVTTRYGYLSGFQRFDSNKSAERIAKRLQRHAEGLSEASYVEQDCN